MTVLQETWFILLGVLFMAYAVLDGFDLGVGFWFLFAPSEERSYMLRTIKPFWDGNEVWLIAGMGTLFAAFPVVYATVLSGFYLEIMVVIFALILRAVAIEFRDALENETWTGIWDVIFSVSSMIPPLSFGLTAGNVLKGLPLDINGYYAGSALALFSHYSIVAGLISLMMFANQGALYLALKSDGVLRQRALIWVGYAWMGYLAAFIDLTVWSISITPHISVNFILRPALFLIPLLGFLSIIGIPILTHLKKIRAAFIVSTLSIILMISMFGASIFPFLVPTFGNPGDSLTIANASSSEKTLGIMLVILLIGMPFVVAYNIYIYRVFRGVIRESDAGY